MPRKTFEQDLAWRELLSEKELKEYERAVRSNSTLAAPVNGQRKSVAKLPVALLCPVCGEEDEVEIDVAGGPRQDFIQDCVVCCRPRRVLAEASEEPGQYHVRLLHEDE
jgi:hypothetical protein